MHTPAARISPETAIAENAIEVVDHVCGHGVFLLQQRRHAAKLSVRRDGSREREELAVPFDLLDREAEEMAEKLV
jgi:hypothetical protein